MNNDSYTPTDVKDLDANDIGKTIRLYTWEANRESATVITADLRQIVHYGDHTTLYIGNGASIEVVMQHGEVVNTTPAGNYSDVRELRAEVARFHGLSQDDLS
jgi:hypothetical protein